MKHLLLSALILAGLAGCGRQQQPDKPAATAPVKPAEGPAHSAVVAHLKKTLDNPASYQPTKWSKAKPWRQQDADRRAAAQPIRFAKEDFEQAKKRSRFTGSYGRKLFNESVASANHYHHQADSLLHSRDTTRLGQVLSHSYRAKNRAGALQLDSARFVVYRNGKVERL